MADEKDWDDMTLEERTDWLRNQLRGLIDFINNRHIPEIGGKVNRLAERVTDLESS